MNSLTKKKAFTLFEMLVALFIFAVLSATSYRIVSDVLTNQVYLNERGDRFSEINRAVDFIRRDIMQLTARTIRDEYGDPQPPLKIEDNFGSKDDPLLELTHGGYRNPLGLPRSNLRRVGYFVEDESLKRNVWFVLDRAQDSEPVVQTLLTDVEEVEFIAIDASGNEYTVWPNSSNSAASPATQLAGIRLRIEAPPFGEIERVWEVPGI